MHYTCEDMVAGLNFFGKNMVGKSGIAPIMTYYPRGVQFLGQHFAYTFDSKPFMNLALVGAAFFTRHFMDLYYIDEPKINGMRKFIDLSFCEDIVMNFLVNYLYPELFPIRYPDNLRGSGGFAGKKAGISSSKTHLLRRGKCAEVFTEMMGEMTPRYVVSNRA